MGFEGGFGVLEERALAFVVLDYGGQFVVFGFD